MISRLRSLFAVALVALAIVAGLAQLTKPSNIDDASDIERPSNLPDASDIVKLPLDGGPLVYEALRDSGGVVLRDSGGNELQVIDP